MVNRIEKTCRKKQHVHIYKNKEMPILICGVVAVGGKDKSTHYSITFQDGYYKELEGTGRIELIYKYPSTVNVDTYSNRIYAYQGKLYVVWHSGDSEPDSDYLITFKNSQRIRIPGKSENEYEKID